MNLKRIGSMICLLTSLASCAGDKPSHDGTANELPLTCPDDYVAYDFGKAPIELDSEYYQASLPADAPVPYYLPTGIKVTGAECFIRNGTPRENTYQLSYDFNTKTTDAKTKERLAAAQSRCDSQTYCTIFDNAWCNYSYTCEADRTKVLQTGGVGDYKQWTGRVSSGGYWFQASAEPMPGMTCLGAGETALRARREARAKASACVPKNCRGKTHRNANLDCSPDPKMEVVSLASMKVSGPSGLTTEINPEFTDQPSRVQTLYANATYRTWATIDYGSVAPKEARLLYWLSDVYVPVAAKVSDAPTAAELDETASKYESKEVFRCTALTLHMGRPLKDDKAMKVTSNLAEQLSPECFADSRVVENLAAKTGLKKPLETYRYLGTRLNRSLDIIGKNLFVPSGATAADADKLCAPNPTEFYFDPTTSTYDMVGYMKQRQVDSLFTVDDSANAFLGSVTTAYAATAGSAAAPTTQDFGGKGSWTRVGGKVPIIRMGPQEVKLGIGELQVTNSKSSGAEIPVDVSWFLAHADPSHLLDPHNTVYNYQTKEQERVVQPVMSFYLWPTDQGSNGAASMPKIGELLLDPSGASADGKTATTTLTIPSDVRKLFYKSGNPMFVPTNNMMRRSFEVVACLDAKVSGGLTEGYGGGRPAVATDSRFFGQDPKLTAEVQKSRYTSAIIPEGSHTSIDFQDDATFRLAIGTGYNDNAFTPWKGFGPGQGCRVAKMPLLIRALRLAYPLQPIQAEEDEGVSENTGTGSSDMSAAQDNDSEKTCTGDDGTNCTEASNATMAGSGEMSRSYYNNDGELNRNEGEKVSVDSTSEMLGMQLVDMADPMGEEEEVGWPKDANANHQAQTPVTLTIAPPWDDIVKALRKGKGKSPVDWNTGRYGGIMGLGLGIGFKVMMQIGPIPGLITITISGGLATELVVELQFAPKDEDAYFCTGDADCVGIETKPLSFAAANLACAKKGGRLGELSTVAEANSVIAAAKGGGGKYWLGGQQTYSYDNPACAIFFNRDNCLPTAFTSYRWLSNDSEFASAEGNSAGKWTSKFSGTGKPAFSTALPTMAALAYDGASDTVSFASMAETHPYVCRYTAVNDYAFLRWKIGANLGVAAGIGISFCVPSDDPGICLGGTLNIVALTLSVEYEHKYYWLRDGNGETYAMAGFTNFSIPWGITLLEGSMYAQINAWIFSIQFNILEFEGFKVAGGKLVDENDIVRIKY